ncbi:hypothetical protein J4461_00440 [Candidatus Pacearchaeota archaeon]|nr:hypothetical protein [Candidatus Pacearchaeota archaeon]
MHSCPSCNREFTGISDYPLVYISKIERLSLASEVQFIIDDPTIFSGPRTGARNQPPREVLEFFRENKEKREYEYKGWTWKLNTDSVWGGPLILSLKERTKEFFGVHIPVEQWELGNYKRFQKGSFSAETITKPVFSYLGHLETLIGKEVPTREVFPKLYSPREGFYNLVGTDYCLLFKDLDNEIVSQVLTNRGLYVPKLETDNPSRKIAFSIAQVKDSGGPTILVEDLAILGGMAYEGRIKS